ncbi:MAG: hypothetical protein ABIJ00_02410 [Candidatus Eisenbacteria bacterium]
MRFFRDTKTVATVTLVSAAAIVLIFLALPALGELKKAKAELRHWEFEIDRLRNFTARGTTEDRVPDANRIPETPDVASMMSVTKITQKEIEVSGLAFETTQTEERFLPELSDENGDPFEYQYSEIRISFDSTTRQAAAFIDSIMTASPGGNVQRIMLTRRQNDRSPIHVSVTIGLCGIPR